MGFTAEECMAGYSSCFCKQRRHGASQESPPGATSALPFTEFVLLSFEFICTPCSLKWTLLVLLLSLLAEVLACVYHFPILSTVPATEAGEVLKPIPRGGCWLVSMEQTAAWGCHVLHISCMITQLTAIQISSQSRLPYSTHFFYKECHSYHNILLLLTCL